MDITFLGHSSFKLKGKTASVITDPYNAEIGLKFPKQQADIVTISHFHSDHNAADLVDGEHFLVSGPGEYEIKGIKIVGVNSFHDDKKGAERGKNIIFSFQIDGLRICHLGDLGQKELGSEQIEEIGSVDILLVPVGGTYTIDASEAAKVAAALEPDIVIPMHYLEPGLANKLDPADKFLKEMGVESPSIQTKISITKDKLPEEMAVILLQKGT